MRKKKYIFNLSNDKKPIYFSTEDLYSNSWFYPRYSNGKIHERNITLKFIEVASSARCFFDIGANIGWYTCIACKCMNDGMVFSFEMDMDNFALLQRNVNLNDFTGARVYHNAVSDTIGLVKYERCERTCPDRLRTELRP
jgi:hypothetical protein